MTYCIGLRLNKGLVFMSDTRTNSGVDNVSTFRKMFTWSKPGDRVITLLTAGNLATTQAVVSLLDERSKAPADRNPSIFEAPSVFQVAQTVGETLREVIASTEPSGETADSAFGATIILGGQVAGQHTADPVVEGGRGDLAAEPYRVAQADRLAVGQGDRPVPDPLGPAVLARDVLVEPATRGAHAEDLDAGLRAGGPQQLTRHHRRHRPRLAEVGAAGARHLHPVLALRTEVVPLHLDRILQRGAERIERLLQ